MEARSLQTSSHAASLRRDYVQVDREAAQRVKPPVHPLSGRVAMSCGPTKSSETHSKRVPRPLDRPAGSAGRARRHVLALDRPRRGNRASSPGTCSSGSPRPASRRRACRCREVDQASAATIQRVIHKGCGRGACPWWNRRRRSSPGRRRDNRAPGQRVRRAKRPVPMQRSAACRSLGIDRCRMANEAHPRTRRCFQSLATRRSRPVRTLLMRGPP